MQFFLKYKFATYPIIIYMIDKENPSGAKVRLRLNL